jgi:hypothetical protein
VRRQRYGRAIAPLLINLSSANQLCNKQQITVLRAKDAPPAVLAARIDASGSSRRAPGATRPPRTQRRHCKAVVRGHAARSIDLSSTVGIALWPGARVTDAAAQPDTVMADVLVPRPQISRLPIAWAGC